MRIARLPLETRCPRCRGFLFMDQEREQSCIACGWHTPIIPLSEPLPVTYRKPYHHECKRCGHAWDSRVEFPRKCANKSCSTSRINRAYQVL